MNETTAIVQYIVVHLARLEKRTVISAAIRTRVRERNITENCGLFKQIPDLPNLLELNKGEKRDI